MISCASVERNSHCPYPCDSVANLTRPICCMNHFDFFDNLMLIEGCFFVNDISEKDVDYFVKDEKGCYEKLDSVVLSKACDKVFFKYERMLGKEDASVEFFYFVDEKMHPFPRITLGLWTPFNNMETSYYYKKGYVATANGGKISTRYISWLKHLVYQEKYMRALNKKGKTDGVAKQSYSLRRLYNVMKFFYPSQNIKIVMDRYLTEGDKGIACYNRLAEDADAKVYFAVDASKRSSLPLPSDRIVLTGSRKYKRLLLCAQTVVYSPLDSKETFFIEPTYIKDILARKWYSVL